jgi:hypothetical protein
MALYTTKQCLLMRGSPAPNFIEQLTLNSPSGGFTIQVLQRNREPSASTDVEAA